MTDDSQEMDLKDFVDATTRSFTEAQQSLLSGSGMTGSMMMSGAELEIKVAVAQTRGSTRVRPISLDDILEGGINPGMLSTVRISLVGSIDDAPETVRESTPVAPKKQLAPNLAGLTLKDADTRLKRGKWKFVAHAASRKDLAAAEENSAGRVVRQQPEAGAPIERNNETIHFWLNLGSIPVQAIDGIGEKMEINLSKMGIRSVGDLSLADVDKLAKFLKMNGERTRDFVNMAALMSRLTTLGLTDEIVEVLTKGAKIRSIEELAKANPTTLHQACSAALTSGKIMTPSKFSITKKGVAEWVESAKTSL